MRRVGALKATVLVVDAAPKTRQWNRPHTYSAVPGGAGAYPRGWAWAAGLAAGESLGGREWGRRLTTWLLTSTLTSTDEVSPPRVAYVDGRARPTGSDQIIYTY